jgi:hypothetical protein
MQSYLNWSMIEDEENVAGAKCFHVLILHIFPVILFTTQNAHI